MEKDYQLFSKYGNFLNYGMVKKATGQNDLADIEKTNPGFTDAVKKKIENATGEIAKQTVDKIQSGAKGEEDNELLTPDEIENEESKIELPMEKIETDEIEPEAKEPSNDKTMSDIEEKFDEINPKEVFEDEEGIHELIEWLEENKKSFEFDDAIFEMEEDNDEKKSFYIVYLDEKISENFPELEDKGVKVITVEEINDDLELKLWVKKNDEIGE